MTRDTIAILVALALGFLGILWQGQRLDTRLTTQINQLDTRLTTQINQLDTRLTTQIDGLDTRLRAVEVALGKVDQRLGTLERIALPAPAAE